MVGTPWKCDEIPLSRDFGEFIEGAPVLLTLTILLRGITHIE